MSVFPGQRAPAAPSPADDGRQPQSERNVSRFLWDAAASRGDAAAVVWGGQITTYRALQARAAALAAALPEAGVTPGERVGIFLDRSADAAAAFFGVLAAGAVAININERLRPRQVEYILGHAGARAVFTTSALLQRQPRALQTFATIIDIGNIPLAGEWTPVVRDGGDLAHIIYTSGSTGLPKGVMVTHANLAAGTRAVIQYLRIKSGDRLASVLPFSFDYGLNQLFCAIASGAALVIETSPLAADIVATLRRAQVTVLAAVPPLWLQLLGIRDFATKPIRSLRAMTNTGGRLPVEAVRKLRRAQPQAELFLMYGLTEAFRATYLPPEEADRRPQSIGKAIPGAEILVLRSDGTPCAPGERGELVQMGPTVAAGYWNDPQTTARVFRPSPALYRSGSAADNRAVYSGDVVWSDDDGFLYFVGRRDKMIKTLGVRVSPDEVIDVLYASGQILEAAVTTEPSPARGESIIAHVVLAPGGSLQALQSYCRTEMPPYMQPARIEVRSELPRTTSGKHDVNTLLQNA